MRVGCFSLCFVEGVFFRLGCFCRGRCVMRGGVFSVGDVFLWMVQRDVVSVLYFSILTTFAFFVRFFYIELYKDIREKRIYCVCVLARIHTIPT